MEVWLGATASHWAFDCLIVATHGEMVTLVVGVRFPEGLKYTV